MTTLPQKNLSSNSLSDSTELFGRQSREDKDKDGKPCGKSHITKTKICRVGGGSEATNAAISGVGKVGVAAVVAGAITGNGKFVAAGLIGVGAAVAAGIIKDTLEDRENYAQFAEDRAKWLKKGVPDHLKGAYDHESKDLQISLLAAENRIKDNTYETLYVFDKQGKPLVIRRGGNASVRLGLKDILKSNKFVNKGAVVTHNHPYAGATFSATDINTAGAWGVSEIRATTGKEVYRLQTKGASQFNRETNRALAQDYQANLTPVLIKARDKFMKKRGLAGQLYYSTIGSQDKKVVKEITQEIEFEAHKVLGRTIAGNPRYQNNIRYTRTPRTLNLSRELKFKDEVQVANDLMNRFSTDQKKVKNTNKDSYTEAFLLELRADRATVNCEKGKRCGNSCIPRSAECKSGNSTPGSLVRSSVEASSTGRVASSKVPFDQNPETQRKLAIVGLGVGATAAVLGVASTVVAVDLMRSSVPFDSIRQPPGGKPDAKTLAKYDTFQPGDLIRKGFKSGELGVRQHYGIYIGKDPKTGEHMMIDSGEDWKSRDNVPVVLKRGLTWSASENDTEYEKVPESEMYLKPGTRRMTREEILQRADRMLYQKLTYTGFESNCEAFARGIVEGKAYSIQGDKVSAFTRVVSGIVTNNGLKLRTANEWFPKATGFEAGTNWGKSVKVGKYEFVGTTEYARDKTRMTAQEMTDFLEKERIREIRRKTWEKIPDPYKVTNAEGFHEYVNLKSTYEKAPPQPVLPQQKPKQLSVNFWRVNLQLTLKNQRKDAEQSANIFDQLGLKTPQEYETVVETLAQQFPGVANTIRLELYKNYFMMLLGLLNPPTKADPNRKDAKAPIGFAGVGDDPLSAMMQGAEYLASNPDRDSIALLDLYREASNSSNALTARSFEQFLQMDVQLAEPLAAVLMLLGAGDPASHPQARADYIAQALQDPTRSQSFKDALLTFRQNMKVPPYPEAISALVEAMNHPDRPTNSVESTLIGDAMQALPVYQGRAYAGLSLSQDKIDALTIGESWNSPQLIPAWRDYFAEYPGTVGLEIYSKDGRDLMDYRNSSYSIVFEGNSQFKVLEKRKITRFDRAFWLVVLQQV